MKLFEIPVYALSKNALNERVIKHQHNLKVYCAKQGVPESDIKRVVDLNTFPMRLWEYNHIMGYIVLYSTRNDIKLDWYVCLPKKKYYWYSKVKRFYQNAHLVGYHFNLEKVDSGKELQKKISNLLFEFISHIDNKDYYVYLTVFNNINFFLDYDRLLDLLKD